MWFCEVKSEKKIQLKLIFCEFICENTTKKLIVVVCARRIWNFCVEPRHNNHQLSWRKSILYTQSKKYPFLPNNSRLVIDSILRELEVESLAERVDFVTNSDVSLNLKFMKFLIFVSSLCYNIFLFIETLHLPSLHEILIGFSTTSSSSQTIIDITWFML